MKLLKSFIRIVVMVSVWGGASSRAADVVLLQSTIVDNNGLNFSSSAANFNRNVNGRTYQRFPMATFKGYQYATYYDVNRNVCLARRKLPSGAWEVIHFTDYNITKSDSHNVVSVGICAKDGTIHLAFDHHAAPLNYRVSVVGAASDPENVVWSTNLFGSVTDQLGSVGYLSSVTYPTFFNAPNGNLMLYYRQFGSGNGNGMIQEYNGTTHDWTTGLGKFIDRSGTYNGAVSSNSTSRNPYINGISYGGNRLHVSWGWRENSGGSQYNHDLNYAYSDDDGRTWYNSAGTQIGTTGSSYITINSPGLIVASIPQNIGLSNQYTHYAFPDGSCHVMVQHNGSYQHYWRNAAGSWSHGTLSFSGSRPKLTGDDDGHLFLVYESGNKPRIAKGVPNAGHTAWSWSLVYTQNVSEGGEGQLDYSRWEADRVLSFYGQEDPSNSGETPSPLHVFDYKVSSKAILPVPANEAVVTNVAPTMEWTAGIGALTHRIYLGTNEAAVSTATTASPEYQGQQSGTVFTPSPALTAFGTYYWRVDEVQSGATVIPGMVWQFNLVPLSGTVTQVVDQVAWDVASTWDPSGVPIAGLEYETAMQLRTPTTSAIFAGDLLTVSGGGELALRNTGASTATVPNLVLNGGNIRAGTGINVTSTLAGNINVLTNANLTGYWSTTGPRNLRIQSKISGNAELRSSASNSASTHTLFIDNPANDFSGTWISEVGTIEFASADAVGSANIDVLADGKLAIAGNWDGLTSGATLTVADSPGAMVNLSSNDWKVSGLVIGSSNVVEGYTYSVAELNAIGVNPVFSGSGTIQVGPPPPPDFLVGWERWVGGAGSTSPATIQTNGITGVATNGGFSASKWAGCNDGTFGSLPAPPASTDKTVNEEGLRKTGATDISIDFAVENTMGIDVEISTFHFDALLKLDNAGPKQWKLEVLSGSITAGEVATNALAYLSSTGDLADYDVDLTGLADHVLDAGGRAVFRLSFTGGTPGNGGYMDLDNVALSKVPFLIIPPAPPVLDYGMSNGVLVINWSGTGFKTQSRTNMMKGSWIDVPGGDIPPVNIDPTNNAEFFRVIQQ